MLVSRGRNPNAAEVISQLFTNAGLRNRVLTTLGLLLLVRLGNYIPIPGIDRVAFKQFTDGATDLIGFLDIFTGGGISTLGVFRATDSSSCGTCCPRKRWMWCGKPSSGTPASATLVTRSYSMTKQVATRN